MSTQSRDYGRDPVTVHEVIEAIVDDIVGAVDSGFTDVDSVAKAQQIVDAFRTTGWRIVKTGRVARVSELPFGNQYNSFEITEEL